MAKPTTKPIAEAERNTLFLKSRGEKIGSTDLRSIKMQATAESIATLTRATERHELHGNEIPPSEVKRIKAVAEILNVKIPA
jgi:hypothetical protein